MKIMAHTVLAYPTIIRSKEIIDQYVEAGFEILELQIPFSHPTADGMILTQANREAAQQLSTNEAMEMLEDIRIKHPQQRIMAMTYLNKLYGYGISTFCDRLAKAGIHELIVPDLPFDSPLAAAVQAHSSVHYIPVVSANTPTERLRKMLLHKPPFVYLMADFKITGSDFSLHPKTQDLIKTIRSLHTCEIGLGFGISTAVHVAKVLASADFAIIGSALMKAVNEDTLSQKIAEFTNLESNRNSI